MDPRQYAQAKAEGRVTIADKAEQLDDKDAEVVSTTVTFSETEFAKNGDTIEVSHTKTLAEIDYTIMRTEEDLALLQAQRADIVAAQGRQISGKPAEEDAGEEGVAVG